MEMLKATDLHYSYEEDEQSCEVLHGIDLCVKKGEFVCILGHNGSGKSTLAKVLGGFFAPTGGKVEVCGMDTSLQENFKAIRQKAGMVFQNPDNQLVATIVEDDIAFGMENLGVPREEMLERISEVLGTVGMSEFRTSAPHKLSGGQKQRIAIAGVLAMRPEILILDEPTAMLDPKGRQEVISSVKELNGQGMTVINITHFMEEAVLADRVLVVSEGRIVLEGTPREVFSKEETMRELALDVPQATSLAHRLSEHGASIATDILTIEELAEVICP